MGGRHGHWQSGQWHLSASRPDLLSKPGMETWGGAPLHKTRGFWQPSDSPYATPPTSTPFFWKPDGWKKLAQEQKAMEATYDAWKQRQSEAESSQAASAVYYGRPSSARSVQSDATSSHASALRKRRDRHALTRMSSSGQRRYEAAAPRHAGFRGQARTMSRADLDREHRYNDALQHWRTAKECRDCEQRYLHYVGAPQYLLPSSGWLDWQRSPAGFSTLAHDNPYTGRALQTHYGSAGPWPSRFPGHTLNESFGRSDSFTNNCYFGTSGQSHNADLRRITRSSPNRVTRVS